MRSNSDGSLGVGFYATIVGVVVAIGIAMFVALLVFSRAVLAWGFLGAFLVLSLILLGIAWIYDRRNARE